MGIPSIENGRTGCWPFPVLKGDLFPLAPLLLTWMANKREPRDLAKEWTAMEDRCWRRRELCLQLQILNEKNSTWYYAEQFFETFPKGREAVMELFTTWGVFESTGRLTPPKVLTPDSIHEFLDLDLETIDKLIADYELTHGQLGDRFKKSFKANADEAREACWQQYDDLKRKVLTVRGEPLLARSFIEAVSSFPVDVPVCMLGASADEIVAWRVKAEKKRHGKGRDGRVPPLICFNKGFSPALQDLIEDKREGERIEQLNVQEGENIDVSKLDDGKVYVVRYEVSEGHPLPLADRSVSVGLNYVWHHIPESQRPRFLGELTRVAVDIGDGRAISIFEPLSSLSLFRMVLGTNYDQFHETAAWDALFGTTAKGGQVPGSFASSLNRYELGFSWREEIQPKLPLWAGRVLLPPQQLAAFAYERTRKHRRLGSHVIFEALQT